MIKLLAIDMDGTCLNDKKLISDVTMQALLEASEAGIMVVPTTGRALTCLPHQIQDQAFYRYVISSNGAVVTDTLTGETIYEAKIPYRKAADFLRQCDENIKVGISAHVDHKFILQGHWLRMLGRLSYGKDAEYSEYSGNLAERIEKEKSDVEEIQLFYFSDTEEQQLKELLSKDDFCLKAFSAHYVEMYDRKASKGKALAALAEYLKIPKENIACIGDEENDLSMFDAAGMKFAMGNATQGLKEKADIVVPTNNEQGVAVAIEKYMMPDRA